MQSSNISSTEFINDPQNNDEDQNIHQNGINDMIQDSNFQLSYSKQKHRNQDLYYQNEPITLANGGMFNQNDGEISPDKIKQKKKQLFDAKEHQSLMELPQREIQSVYSPSQQQQTPSQNDLSIKLEVNPSKRGQGSSACLSLDLKLIEDKQKRQSVIRQKLNEMHDHSIDYSLKGISNDQSSQIAKFGSQFDRDDSKYLQTNAAAQQQNNQPQGLSQYNPHSNRNGNTSNSSAQNAKQNRPAQNTIPHQLPNNQSNQDGTHNISNLQIERSGINNNILLTPDSNKLGDEGITSSKMKRLKLQQNAYPPILQQKRDRLVNLFIQKLKETTVVLRKPFNLKMRHYQMINDISCLTNYSSSSRAPANYQQPNSFCFRTITNILDFISQKLPNVEMIEPNSMFSFLNSIIQSIAILIIIFGTTLSMVFPTGQSFLDNFLNGWMAIICICLFSIDIIVHFNTNAIRETDEKKIIPTYSRQLVAQAYFKGTFFIDLATITLLIIDTQVNLQLYSNYFHFLRIFIFLKIFSLFLHQRIIYNYLLTQGQYIVIYEALKLILIIFTIAHLFSLAWFGVAYNLHKQNNFDNWIDQMEIQGDRWDLQYLNALFWGVSIITLIGSSKPKTINELIISSFAMVLGFIFISLIFLWMKQLYERTVQIDQENNLKDTIQIVSQYMSKKAICNNLKTRVLFHLQQEIKRKQKQQVEEKECQVFDSLPIELRKELREQSNSNILSQLDIFNKLFSQKALDSLLFYVEEINYLPNQIIYEENVLDDSSIYFLIDGSVGVYQGELKKNEEKKYVQTIKKGQVFGEICFFTGMVRSVSMIALEYVKVGKIKRQSLLEVIQNQQDDLERFCMIRDTFMLYDDVSCLGVSCFSCGKTNHVLKDCPLIHLQFDKVKIIHRHIYSAEQIRNSNFKRRNVSHKKSDPYYIAKKSGKVIEMLRDDSICHQKLNEMIEQLNIFELDEENYDEEEEIDEDEDYIGNSKTIPEEDDSDKQLLIQRDDNYTLKNFSDQEDEGLKQQMMKQSKQPSMNINNNNNNNINNSGRGDSNNTPNTANNPYTENSSQLSKQVKSLRKDSSSTSQMNGEAIINKEYKKEMTYNTVYTDQQFQGYEYFLQESTSNNNQTTTNNINSINATVNVNSNNPTLNNINTNASVEPRISIPDLAHHFIYESQPKRIADKKLTTQTAPQIYSRTKSFASRKSKKQSSSPEQQAQSTGDKNAFQDTVLDPSLCKELTRDFTLNSKKSKRHLKFADEQILGQMIEIMFYEKRMKADQNFKNNQTSTSIQLSPYQESMSSKDNSNYSPSIQQSNYMIQQFQNLLMKFQSVFRQINQAQRYNSLAQSLDKMNHCDKDSDFQYEINSHKNSNKDNDHKSSSNVTQKKVENSALLYKQHTSLSRLAEEWNLEKLKNYKIYFPHNNFSFIYPQIQLIQKTKFNSIQMHIQIPIKISPSNPSIQQENQNDYLPLNAAFNQNFPQILNEHNVEPRKTISTNLSQNRTRKSQYSLTYGVQINSKPFRHFGSLNSGNSSLQRLNQNQTNNQNTKYSKKQNRKNHSQSSSEYSHIKKS